MLKIICHKETEIKTRPVIMAIILKSDLEVDQELLRKENLACDSGRVTNTGTTENKLKVLKINFSMLR